jgi:hypothetical protein
MWGSSDTQTRVLHVVCVEGGRGWRGGARAAGRNVTEKDNTVVFFTWMLLGWGAAACDRARWVRDE